ncbi:MAG: hypothetical protein KFB95_00215 [Simkaniaceae bacterium]|nr:MAG: hypothetical protein KFB95_00215 [Simkaniaceae bacterium]
MNPLRAFPFSRERKNAFKHGDDFNTLMGSNKSVWKFVKTHEDYQNIRLFTALYEKNSKLQFLKNDGVKIPKVVHVIWVGPNPFPKEGVENVNSWIEKHPDWTIKFWTDRRRPLPNRNMKLNLVSDFNFETLGDYYEESDNYAEKSDLLRYEILYQEGGLYVDHDVKCFKSFAPFHHNFDLYCGLEPPHEPVLNSSISVNNNVIGTCPKHPILKKTIEHVKERWNEISIAYPGSDKESIIYRVAQRSWSSFGDSVRELIGKGETKDIAFPAAYFNRIDDGISLFAHHYYASTWFEDETKFERTVRRRLVSISRKNNQILLFNAVILAVNLALFAGLWMQLIAMNKRSNAMENAWRNTQATNMVTMDAAYLEQTKNENAKIGFKR